LPLPGATLLLDLARCQAADPCGGSAEYRLLLSVRGVSAV